VNRFRYYLLAVLVFMAAGVASYWLWQHERHNAELNRRANLDFSLREITSSIEQRMASYMQVMMGVQAFFSASDRVEPRVLRAYVESLQLGADFAGIEEISVVGVATVAGRMDPYADPARRVAMDGARDSGRLTMTGKLKSSSTTGSDSQASFVMFLPLYQGGQHPATLADRRASLRGWVMAPVRMNDLMASLYGERALTNDIKIHDGVQLTNETLMFDSARGEGARHDAPVELTDYLVLAGRTWAVTVRARADTAVSSGKDSSNLIALGGTGFTLLLTMLAWVLVTGRARAMAAATAMTVELREGKERSELIFNTSPDGVMVSRWVDGIIVDTNNRFTTLTGFTREDLLGRRVSDIRLWADPVQYQKFIDEMNEKGFCENFEANFLMKDGTARVSLISGKKFRIRGVPHIISIARDISERKETELRMTHMAQHDPLTGLPNRALFYDRFQQELAHAKRDRTRLALMFLDLDRFKPVNDTLGHAVGDLLLKEVGLRLTDCVRQSDTVGRIGGDEFVVLLPDIKDDQDALLMALKIRQALEQPFTLTERHTVHISCSTGIATYPEHGADEIELSKNSDAAMYLAKDRGRNRTELFSPT
jgi:diguanylate cyclase (GGDEF)-like protein/PAS domain S-box-containing protein